MQVRCRRLQSIGQSTIAFVGDAKAVTAITDSVNVARWAAALTASTGKAVSLKAIEHSVELRCTLACGRVLMASAVLDPVAGVILGTRREACQPTDALLELLRAAWQDAERAGRRAAGGVAADLAELAAFPDTQEEITCPVLTGAQVRAFSGRFARLRSLTLVELPGTAVPDADTLPALATLTSLRTLTLAGKGFDGTAIARLGVLELRRLSLSGCSTFDARAMQALTTWKSLEELDLLDVPAAGDGEALATLKSFPTLVRLGIESQSLADAELDHLLTTRLRVLRLRGGAGITGAGLARLAGLPSLRELHLSGLQDGNVPLLSELPMIGRLFARGTWLGNADALELGALRQLQRLDLRNTGIGAEIITQLRGLLPGCKVAANADTGDAPIGNFAQVLTGQF